MVVVADSSALIALATCQALELLTKLYDDIKVPQGVYDEVATPDKPQAQDLAVFLAGHIVKVDTSQFVLAAAGLGKGEVEAMALYKAISADILLIDDRRARAIAEANNIQCIGALGILLVARNKNLIARVNPYVQILRESSLHYSEVLLTKVIQLAGE